jgi:hypothetical protein
VEVQGPLAGYVLGAVQEERARSGGALGAVGRAWAELAKGLPEPDEADGGSAIAVDLTLAPGQHRVVTWVLAWQAPTWNAGGHNWAGADHTFSHTSARLHPAALETACLLAREHRALLRRVLAWQAVLYGEAGLPVWLRDGLVNVLHLLTECGMWAQQDGSLPAWVRQEDGLFGLNECPRGCPQIECLPPSALGTQPLAYFFPELALSTLRGYLGYQYADGTPTWVFGGCTDRTPPLEMTSPTRGYQHTSNGISVAMMLDLYRLWIGYEGFVV